MVSFERVFEVIDLPQDIAEKENAIELRDVKGELEFNNVTFNYKVDESILLKDVKRYGKMENVKAVFSGGNDRRPQTAEEWSIVDRAVEMEAPQTPPKLTRPPKPETSP
jgi:hypothetical protein